MPLSRLPAGQTGPIGLLSGGVVRDRNREVDAQQRAQLAQDVSGALASSPPESTASASSPSASSALGASRSWSIAARTRHRERRRGPARSSAAPRRRAGGAARCRPGCRCRATRSRTGSGGASSASRIARGSATFSRSLMKTRLPSDLLIFSPSYATIAECSQWRHERLAGERLALGDLALVVREDQVRAAAVQVERRARAPASTSPSTRCATPAGRRRTAPAMRARRRATAARARSRAGRGGAGRRGCRLAPAPAAPSAHASTATAHRSLGADETSKYAVPWVRYAWPESSSRSTIDTISSIVSVARGSAIGGRMPSASMSDAEPRDLRLGELEVRDAELAGLRQDRVVDVGDVADHPHLVAELLEPAGEDVVGQVRRRVAEVGRVVRGDPADVHPHDVLGRERHDHPPRGVVELDHRRQIPLSRSPASHLVPDVDRQQHRGERLHADRVLERAAVEGAEVGDALDDRHERGAGVVVVAARHDVALHLLVEVDELGRGHEVERGDDLGPPEQRLHLLGRASRAAAAPR